MYRKIAVLFVAALFIFTGCKGKGLTGDQVTTAELVEKTLLEMENYGATAYLKRFSNKGENTYQIRQFYKNTGEYRVEILAPEKVAGCITIFDGAMVSQFNPQISGKIAIDVPESRARDEMFLGEFMKNYTQSQDVTISAANMDDTECIVLEATIPGDHPYLATEKLWVDAETVKPTKLTIYDPSGKEKIELIFENFEYNMELEDGLFQITVNE